MELINGVLFAVVVICLFKFAGLLKLRWMWQTSLKDFPMHPRGIFLLGHAKAFIDGARGMLCDWDPIYTNNERAVQVWMSPFNAGVICYHPDTIKPIFNTAEPKDDLYKLYSPWLGDGLLISYGHKWARNRRLLTPAFHFDILKPYVKVFSDTANELTKLWKLMCEDGACSVEVMTYMSMATLESLMKCIMGVDGNLFEEGNDNSYVQANHTLTDQAVKRFSSILYQSDWIYALSSDGFTNRKALQIAHAFCSDVIQQRKSVVLQKDYLPAKGKLVPFLDILLMAKDEDGSGLTDQEIADEVNTFMFEGHDTTSSGLSFIIYNLAANPLFQERCRNEVDTVLDNTDDGTLRWDDLTKLEYLTKFIKESLRKNTPVPSVARKLTSPLTLPDGRVIPEGCAVYCHMHGVHHNPNVWDDPHVFDPERFSLENSTRRSPHAYVPFAAGPRNCIGQRFALEELKTVTAVLLHHFRFVADPSKPIQRINKTVVRSTTGIHLTIEKRD